jgi:hypothetical protein
VSTLELARPINSRTVEDAYRLAMAHRERGLVGIFETGRRLARERNPKLLLALEKGAEVLNAIAEEQHGRTSRDWGTPRGMRVWPTEASLWREAYKSADSGNPLDNFGWIYGSAAWLAGLYD